MKIYSISNDFIDIRIDKWIKLNICKVPQGLIEKNLRNKNITVNFKKIKSSYKLKINDNVYLNNFNPKTINIKLKKKFTPSKSDIKDSKAFIIEDNENFCVINKPFGLPVQGGSKITKNLIDLVSSNPIFHDAKPYIVHRIDKDTSGILIIAKNKKYAQLLTSLFRIRKIHKTYLCVCSGEIEKSEGLLEDNLIRFEKNKKIVEKAITKFKVIDKNKGGTLLVLNPITGRKHQLRKQYLYLVFR